MYPAFLPDDKKAHWYNEDIFFDKRKIVDPLIKENYSIDMHSQEFYEINIVLSGSGRHYINNNSMPVKAGHTFIIPPMVKHGYVGQEGFDVFHLLISPNFWNQYAVQFQKLPSFYSLFGIEPLMRTKRESISSLILTKKQLNEINATLKQLLLYSEYTDMAHRLLNTSNSVILITKLCMIYDSNMVKQPKADSNEDDNRFAESLSLIYQNYNEKITIKRLAETALLSRTAYIKHFVKTIGMPPIQFLTKHRITVAKNLLYDTKYTLDEIAAKTGFYDASHFIRCFEKEIGLSPTKFREIK